jgi:hypothetical protein
MLFLQEPVEYLSELVEEVEVTGIMKLKNPDWNEADAQEEERTDAMIEGFEMMMKSESRRQLEKDREQRKKEEERQRERERVREKERQEALRIAEEEEKLDSLLEVQAVLSALFKEAKREIVNATAAAAAAAAGSTVSDVNIVQDGEQSVKSSLMRSGEQVKWEEHEERRRVEDLRRQELREAEELQVCAEDRRSGEGIFTHEPFMSWA